MSQSEDFIRAEVGQFEVGQIDIQTSQIGCRKQSGSGSGILGHLPKTELRAEIWMGGILDGVNVGMGDDFFGVVSENKVCEDVTLTFGDATPDAALFTAVAGAFANVIDSRILVASVCRGVEKKSIDWVFIINTRTGFGMSSLVRMC
jgi:hypothetical protein